MKKKIVLLILNIAAFLFLAAGWIGEKGFWLSLDTLIPAGILFGTQMYILLKVLQGEE